MTTPMLRWVSPLALLTLGPGLVACDRDRPSPAEPGPDPAAAYLFEVELENHDPRFPPYWLGLSVEGNGAVYEYDRSPLAPTLCSHAWQWLLVDECAGRALTRSQLADRYQPGRSLLVELPADVLATRRGQIGNVDDGPFSQPNRACNDAGILGLVAFQRAGSGDRYHPLVLRLEGDQMRQNLSPGAQELTPWLLELAEQVPFVAQWRRGTRDCRPD